MMQTMPSGVVASLGGAGGGLGDADAGGFWKGIVRAGGGKKWCLRLVGVSPMTVF